MNSIPQHGGKRAGAGRKPNLDRQQSLDLYNQAKAKKEAALAELAEIEVRVKRGELLPADVVLAHWQGMIASMRSRLLALPSRLAAVTMGCQTLQESERAAMALVREALTEISQSGHPHD